MRGLAEMRWLWLIPLLSLWAAVAGADEPAKADARASVGGAGPFWVGQAVPVILDLRSTAFAFSDQRLDAPQVEGALVLNPESGALKLTEQQDGETWQVQRYEYRVFPQRAGSLTVPPLTVAFSVSAGYGKPQQDFSFTTEPLGFEARRPLGAKPDVPLVTTTSFVVEQTWEPAPESLKVGDALTRRVTFRAVDLPGMALPTLGPPRIAGIAVYPEQPRVQDRAERGTLEGERIESLTLLMQRAGSYEIPGAPIQWWNPQSQTLTELAVEPLSIEVASNPALAAAQAVDELLQRPWLLAGAAIAAVVGLVVLVLAARAVRVRWRTWQERRSQSEQGYFERLQKACRSDDASAIYTALTRWLARLRDGREGPVTLQGLLTPGGTPPLAGQLETLQSAVANRQPFTQGPELARLLTDARKQLQSARNGADKPLPDLNPRAAKVVST